MPSKVEYNLTFYGIDFDEDIIDHRVDIELKEQSNVEVIEYSYAMIHLPKRTKYEIKIEDIEYSFKNPEAISALSFYFIMPRYLYFNEILELDLGKDILAVNPV